MAVNDSRSNFFLLVVHAHIQVHSKFSILILRTNILEEMEMRQEKWRGAPKLFSPSSEKSLF